MDFYKYLSNKYMIKFIFIFVFVLLIFLHLLSKYSVNHFRIKLNIVKFLYNILKIKILLFVIKIKLGKSGSKCILMEILENLNLNKIDLW